MWRIVCIRDTGGDYAADDEVARYPDGEYEKCRRHLIELHHKFGPGFFKMLDH